MLSTNQLGTLKRIVDAIITYRQQTVDDQNAAGKDSKGIYLKQHLSVQDWTLWQFLQVDDRAIFLIQKAPQSSESLSLQQFRLLLSQYKRAAYELIQVWKQAQQ